MVSRHISKARRLVLALIPLTQYIFDTQKQCRESAYEYKNSSTALSAIKYIEAIDRQDKLERLMKGILIDTEEDENLLDER
jgi:hypothetical protein